MRIIVTASGDSRDAETLNQILLMTGHEVLLKPSTDFSSFKPDVVISYGTPVVVPDSLLVQVNSGSLGRFSDDVDLFVFSGASRIPESFQRRYAVIPQPVDTVKFSPSLPQDDEQIILSLGELNPRMGHKVLVQAMTLVNSGLRAVIAGREDYYTVMQMSEYARTLDVHKRVLFTANVEDVHSLLGRAAVGVVTSFDSQPVSREAKEMMASGVPLLLAAADDLYDIARDGDNVLFHSPGNWRQLASQINHMIENRGLAEMLALNARQYCEKHLSYESVGEKWTGVLEQLCFG